MTTMLSTLLAKQTQQATMSKVFTRGMSLLSVNTGALSTGGSYEAGRSSVSGVTATVFGASGFIGRYVVNELGKIGSQVVMPYRCTENDVQHLRVMGDLGQMALVDFDADNVEDIKKHVRLSNVVINVIGRDRETKSYSFEDVNIRLPKTIAEAAKEAGAERFFHFSCVGASPDAPSKKLRTKFEGEQAVLEAFPDATIIRLAPVVGVEDRLLNSYAFLTKRLSYVPLYDGGYTKMQPVWIRDVSAAFMETLKTEESKGKIYELGGPVTYTVKELVTLVEKTIRESSSAFYVPSAIGKALDGPRLYLQKLLPMVPLPPFHNMMSADYIDELQSDLVVSEDALSFKDLGITPKRIDEGVPIEHVRFWRSGGYDLGSNPTE